jgi:hypothetical protein
LKIHTQVRSSELGDKAQKNRIAEKSMLFHGDIVGKLLFITSLYYSDFRKYELREILSNKSFL